METKRGKGAGLVLLLFLALAMAGLWAFSATAASTPAQAEVGVASTFTLLAQRDSWINEAEPYTNYGDDDQLVVGLREERVELRMHTLLWFDLSPLPAGTEVISATLRLYQTGATGSRLLHVAPEAIQETWDEMSVTWNNQPAHVTMDDPTRALDTVNGWKTWDVTHIVKHQLLGEIENHGILLSAVPDQPDSMRYFATRTSRSAPRLVITYSGCLLLRDPEQIPEPGLIDFDDLPRGTVIGESYRAPHGVRFEDSDITRAIISAEPQKAYSPPNVALNEAVHPHTSSGVPMRIWFDQPKSHAGFWIGNGSGQTNLTAVLTAFNANGQAICSLKYSPVPEAHQAFFGLYDPTGQIRLLELDYGLTEISEAIDDLRYHPRQLPTATATPSPTITPTPSPTATPTPTRTPIALDLIAGRLEVTQGIQDLNNSVRLVRGKRTFVRFHVRATYDQVGYYDTSTTANLVVSRGNNMITLLPLNPGGEIWVQFSPDRGKLNHAFLFELPHGFRTGTVSMAAAVNPIIPDIRPERSPLESNYANNVSPYTTVTFEEVPSVRLKIYRVGYRVGGTTYYPEPFHAQMLASWLRRAYPLSSLNLHYRSHWYGLGNVSGETLTHPSCGWVNARLYAIKVWDYAKSFGSKSWAWRYYGLVSDEGGFMRGCARVPGYTASGPTGTGDWGWDFDGSYGDWYGAHELGHNYGRHHVNFCGATGGPPYPHPHGRISPRLTGNRAIYGFDVLHRTIYGPDWHDLMSYCSNLWISDFTYHALMTRFQTTPVLYAADMPAAEAVDRLLVAGFIDPATNQVTLEPLFIIPEAIEPEPRVPGDYAIVLRGSGGAELARYPFTPDEIIGGPAPQEYPIADDEFLGISELVPYMDGTEGVDIEGPGGVVLETVTAGPAPPSVTVLSPSGGEVFTGPTIPISWTASDPDGDELIFNILYSPDNGANWVIVASTLTETTVELPAENFPGGTEGLVRVWASDGINTAYDTSDGFFTIPNRPPEVEIIAPFDGATYIISQTVPFEAEIYDIDSGTLPDESIMWRSSQDGLLGNGAQLSVADLSVGTHTVTVRADDGDGGVTDRSISVVITDVLAPQAVPDELLAGPPLITLQPAFGRLQYHVSVENANVLNPMPWNAVVDVPWLDISPASGTTPQEMRVHYMGTGLSPIVHTGYITVTSPALPGESVVLRVNVDLAEKGTILPLLLKH